MTRDELVKLYEQELCDFLSNTPCVGCGGSDFIALQNIQMSAFFFVELSERWKDKQAAQMSAGKAAKTSYKKMERHFNEVTEKALEGVLTPSRSDTPSHHDETASESSSSPEPPSSSPSPSSPEKPDPVPRDPSPSSSSEHPPSPEKTKNPPRP